MKWNPKQTEGAQPHI